MLMNNNDKYNQTITTSNKTYKKSKYLYTQPKLFNIIYACRDKGLRFGLYTLFVPLFFFSFYKEYIASIDIVLILALILLNYVIRPAVNNNYIKKISYHTDFKMNFLSRTTTIMISAIYRLSIGIISEIGNMYYYDRSFDFSINSTYALITAGISLLIISMFLFPRNLEVVKYHTQMTLNYQNEIDKIENQNRLNNYYNDSKKKYKSYKYDSKLNIESGSSTTSNKTNNKSKTNNTQTGPTVKKSDRRRRIF